MSATCVKPVSQTIRALEEETTTAARNMAPGPGLFETSAEVLGGLITAYEHFEHTNEAA